jgi:hypothetical protein
VPTQNYPVGVFLDDETGEIGVGGHVMDAVSPEMRKGRGRSPVPFHARVIEPVCRCSVSL